MLAALKSRFKFIKAGIPQELFEETVTAMPPADAFNNTPAKGGCALRREIVPGAVRQSNGRKTEQRQSRQEYLKNVSFHAGRLGQ